MNSILYLTDFLVIETEKKNVDEGGTGVISKHQEK